MCVVFIYSGGGRRRLRRVTKGKLCGGHEVGDVVCRGK